MYYDFVKKKDFKWYPVFRTRGDGLSAFINDQSFVMDLRVIPEEIRLPSIKCMSIVGQPEFKRFYSRKTGIVFYNPKNFLHCALGEDFFDETILGRKAAHVKFYYFNEAFIYSDHYWVVVKAEEMFMLNSIHEMLEDYSKINNQEEAIWIDYYQIVSDILLSLNNRTWDNVPLSKEESNKIYWKAKDRLKSFFEKLRFKVYSTNSELKEIAPNNNSFENPVFPTEEKLTLSSVISGMI